ncbi:hypothetical protein LX32DRAFT_639117 [Colletotrichum zoysiae]|uniref:Uncharacterized protein n=1 Tax=Colletotrichum zoysiae TaxID=1216348 RepID=A0AAD9M1M6_9PEZI|nr:hypothetical protein LX32DRAFT_639117 [Colletotrichum zoysiae]
MCLLAGLQYQDAPSRVNNKEEVWKACELYARIYIKAKRGQRLEDGEIWEIQQLNSPEFQLYKQDILAAISIIQMV